MKLESAVHSPVKAGIVSSILVEVAILLWGEQLDGDDEEGRWSNVGGASLMVHFFFFRRQPSLRCPPLSVTRSTFLWVRSTDRLSRPPLSSTSSPWPRNPAFRSPRRLRSFLGTICLIHVLWTTIGRMSRSHMLPRWIRTCRSLPGSRQLSPARSRRQ